MTTSFRLTDFIVSTEMDCADRNWQDVNNNDRIVIVFNFISICFRVSYNNSNPVATNMIRQQARGEKVKGG
jgi:hypothetical protein